MPWAVTSAFEVAVAVAIAAVTAACSGWFRLSTPARSFCESGATIMFGAYSLAFSLGAFAVLVVNLAVWLPPRIRPSWATRATAGWAVGGAGAIFVLNFLFSFIVVLSRCLKR